MSEMTMEERFPHITQEFLEEIGRLGEAIYAKLEPQLEPAYHNQFVTIHVDMEDYAVAKSASASARAMRDRHSLDGRLYTRKIGDEPEYGLAARIMASDMRKAQQK